MKKNLSVPGCPSVAIRPSIPAVRAAFASLAAMASMAIAAALQLSACDSRSHDHGPDGGFMVEACEHMAGGPAEAATAAAGRDDSLPDVSGAHTRYDITLPDIAGSREGYVAFRASEAAVYHFALGVDAVFGITDSSGAAVEPEEAADRSALCPEVKVVHAYRLDAGRHALHIAAGFETSVSLVAVEGGDHGH